MVLLARWCWWIRLPFQLLCDIGTVCRNYPRLLVNRLTPPRGSPSTGSPVVLNCHQESAPEAVEWHGCHRVLEIHLWSRTWMCFSHFSWQPEWCRMRYHFHFSSVVSDNGHSAECSLPTGLHGTFVNLEKIWILISLWDRPLPQYDFLTLTLTIKSGI